MMLQDMLESDGGYQVEVAHRGSQVLDHLQKNDYDLTIVDMGLDASDMGYQELIQGIRRIRATMRVMLIPLMGEDLPAEARRLDIQGTLSKPFFADDLLPNIQDALARQVRPPAPPPPVPASPLIALERAPAAVAQASQVQSVLSELARETRADVVLLLSSDTVGAGIIGHVSSTLDDDQLKTLAALSVDTIQAARAAALFLGQPDAPFEHHMFESDSLRLYMMALPADCLLVIVAPVSTPLGTIRHNLRRAARELAHGALT
jgi:CheY-like chemotaxis protein/predicted regulator of Ras-like GTPase activity (Roadblock/LC7/MglB family)